MKIKLLLYISVPVFVLAGLALMHYRPDPRKSRAPERSTASSNPSHDEPASEAREPDRTSLRVAAALLEENQLAASAAAPPSVQQEQPESEPPAEEDQVAHLDLVYSHENLDPEWSSNGERKVRELLRPIAGNSTMESVECRSTLCRVEAKHSNEADFQQFINGLIENSREAWKGSLYSVRDQNSQGGVIRNVVFLAKEGLALPLLE